VARTRVINLGFLLGALLPAAAWAQGGSSGSITGNVFDQTGTPLKGIKIVATSPTQIGGSKTTYTNDEGFFRLPALFPGKFDVRATAPKLQTYLRKDVVVGITSAVELNIVMEVETSRIEEVKVVEKAPVVSTTTSNVKEVYDLEFVESLPMAARDQVHTNMINEVAGANNGRMRGGSGNQTMFTQDGFELNATNGTYPVLKSSAAYEVNTAGYGADAPTSPGGMINLVTKSGSNKTEFELNATADLPQLRFGTDGRDTPFEAIGPQGINANSYYIVAPMVAGPIIKDKLWYFVTDEFHFIDLERGADPEGLIPGERPTYKKFIHKGTLKLTWQINARNKLSSLTNMEWPISEQNQREGIGIPLEAQRWRIGRRMFTGLIWESLLRDNLILRAQAGLISLWSHVYPYQCRDNPEGCDDIPSVQNQLPRTQYGGNDNSHSRDDLFSVQTMNQLEWYPERRLLGEHSLTLRHRIYTENNAQYRSVPGDRVTEYAGVAPIAEQVFFANDPRYEDPRFGWHINQSSLLKSTSTLSDQWKPTRYLTVTPSLSHIYGRASNSRAAGAGIANQGWVPGLAVAWDASHDGRTVLRGSASSYLDVDILDVARHAAGSQSRRRCLWNPANDRFDLNCEFSGGLTTNTYGSPCGPTGINPDGTSCIEKLKLPRTNEYTLGAEREVITGLAVSLDLIYRKFENQFDRRETNRIYDQAGSQLERLGQYRNGRAEQIMDFSTPDSAWRKYQGMTLGLNKREGRFKSHVSYTLASLTGTQQDINNRYGDIPGRDLFLEGYLPDDHRHEVKWTLSWQATPWLSFGGRYKYLSGQPYSRLFYNPVSNSWELYKARVGVNPGNNLNDPDDDRELRLPDRQDMSVQVRTNLFPLIGHRLDLYVDVINVLGLRTATAFGEEDARNFGVETGWMAPFKIRLGMNYKY
jgi:hypothetical protein